MHDGRYTTYGARSGRDPRRRRRQRVRRRRLFLLVLLVLVAVILALVFMSRGRGEETAAGDGNPGGEPAVATSPSPTPTPPPKVWAASKADPVRVWVGGDSMGGELGFSLQPVLQETKAFRPTTFYKESTGICRYDFYNWGKQIKKVMKSARPHAAVIMIGTNDTQSVWTDDGWIPYGDTAWKRAYEDRVGAIIDTMLRGGARRVYWVGMPIMGEGWRNSRMKLINRIFRKQAEMRPGAEYIDIWDLYATDDGSFDPSLRLRDRVHFTVGGQRLLADTVYGAIRRDWLPAGLGTSGASAPATPSASASPF
jgi:hypothetical protein